MEKASKNFIANLKKQKRENKSLLFLDNAKIIKDALKLGSILPQTLLTSLDDNSFFALGFGKKLSCDAFSVDAKTIEMLSDSKTPQGLICVAEMKKHQLSKPEGNFLVLDGLQDPGNVGTLIRTALAVGFESVFILDGVRVSNAKLIRSSAGAIFSVKVHEMSRNDFEFFAKNKGLSLVCCDMEGENIFDFSVKGNVGVVVGNEGQGVCKQIASLCSCTVKIPMKNGIESLNAGVSGAIVMYQIAKDNFKQTQYV